MLFFCIIVTFGFIYELGKGALIISSRQLNNSSFFDKKPTSSNDNLAYSTSSLNIDLKSLSAAYAVYAAEHKTLIKLKRKVIDQ